MNAYFTPDISKLREVPRAEAEKLLGIGEEEGQELPPNMQVVEHLLHMIQFARQTAPSAKVALS